MTEREQQLASEVFGQPEQSTSVLGAIMDGIQAIAPGLDWDKFVGDVGHELSQQWDHGRHEIAAALFAGEADGFIMYPRRDPDGREDEHGVHGRDEQQQDRGGMEM